MYYQSVRRYLNLEIEETYFPKTDDGRSIAIREFSFIEVNNAFTFEMNEKILVDIVKTFRIKYSTKHQFLGEFFEQLLNTHRVRSIAQKKTHHLKPLVARVWWHFGGIGYVPVGGGRKHMKFYLLLISMFCYIIGHFCREIMQMRGIFNRKYLCQNINTTTELERTK